MYFTKHWAVKLFLFCFVVTLLVITCRKDIHQVEQNSNPFKQDTLHSEIK